MLDSIMVYKLWSLFFIGDLGMQYIDEKFKDNDPIKTVEIIRSILKNIGIEVEETVWESGVENCCSTTVCGPHGVPSANGKGVSKEFALASAYGEFIERIQGGLFLYKYQSLIRQKDMNVHAFAPDAKYMTTKELEENGEWMDYIIKEYNNPAITRESIAKQCKMYACADDDRILTLPFYSLFEKKYVYLPMGFVDQIYGTNGCCAGNTREEAWVHAFSEMMERHANLKMFLKGEALPKIPDEILNKYPVVSRIIKEVRESGLFDIDIFDCSIGNGYPVVSSRIIDKRARSYKVNVASDPVFEIALQRTLTELFQGNSINKFVSYHRGKILNKVTDFPVVSNVTNQLEMGSGYFTADFFADDVTCNRKASVFADNSNKTNKELLEYALDVYKKIGKPVYVRNFSFLGFHSYRFVIPGFSEALAVKLSEPIFEYGVYDKVCKTLRNPIEATKEELTWLLTASQMVLNMIGRYKLFNRLSGTLISGRKNAFLAGITRAYAAYRLGRYKDALKFIGEFKRSADTEELIYYFECVEHYVELKLSGIEDAKIKSIIYKFNKQSASEKLYNCLDNGKTPFDEFLLKCDYKSCDKCKYKDFCAHENIAAMNRKVGEIYKDFIHGQDEAEFEI